MNSVLQEPALSTADLVAAADSPRTVDPAPSASTTADPPGISAGRENSQLAALFLPASAKDFQAQWDAVQIGFVDDPKQAVRQADELVAQVMKSLAETFYNERTKLESQVEQPEQASTENLRIALHRYRSFFQRLLSL
jgi:hypothetical protein